MSRRRDKLLGDALGGLREDRAVACALVFLHELSDPFTPGQPPREARWERIVSRPREQWGAAVDEACQACLARWPEHLAGFFPDAPLAGQSSWAVGRAVDAIAKVCERAPAFGGPGDRRTILASVNQDLRSLTAKQWQGAFFTPWNIAEMMARMLVDQTQPREEWILEPAVGGAVMLLAYLEAYRRLHGLTASRAVSMIGVDIDAQTCTVARASLLLAAADPRQFWIFHGNALAQPIVGRNRVTGQLHHLQWHAVLTNPPFNGRETDASLQAWADRGPLIVPDRMLYRTILMPRGTDMRQDPTPAQAAAKSAESDDYRQLAGKVAKRSLPEPPAELKALLDRKRAA